MVDSAIPWADDQATSVPIAGIGDGPRLLIHFNAPIQSASTRASDFEIDQIAEDGSISHTSFQNPLLAEFVDSANSASSSLLLTSKLPLGPGNYEVVMLRSNHLTDLSRTIRTSPTDQVLLKFSTEGSMASSGRDLGTVDATTSFSGLPVDPQAADAMLSKITVGAGKGWTFSPTFQGQSPDHYRVNLFDANQELIASTSADDLTTINQHLFPGTYYVEFYSKDPANLATSDLVDLKVVGTTPSLGPLNVASVAAINRNDLSEDPDSIVVQFAGSSLPSSLPITQPPNFFLVDARGDHSRIMPIAYDSATNQMTLALSGSLPTGHYTLEVGLSQSAMTPGSSLETVGSFDTVSRALPANDLGTIFPSSSVAEWKNPTWIAPGGSVGQQFSIIQGEHYEVKLSNPNLTCELFQMTTDGRKLATSRMIEIVPGGKYYLEPGVYEFVAGNASPTQQQVSFSVMPSQTTAESLATGGVVQMASSGGQWTLVGGSTPVIGNQNVVAFTPVSSSNSVSASPAPGRTSTTSAPIDSTGSFTIVALNQTPVGSFSAIQSSSPSTARDSPISTEAMVATINSTIFLTPSSTTLKLGQPRSSFSPNLKTAPISPEVNPNPTPGQESGAEGRASQADQTQLPGSSTEVEAATVPTGLPGETLVDATVNDVVRLVAIDEPTLNTRADAEPATISVRFADMASPLGLLMGACFVYRRIKLERSASGFSSWSRPWSLSKLKSNPNGGRMLKTASHL